MPGQEDQGNQVAEGWDLPPGPLRGKSKEIGAQRRENESSMEGSTGPGLKDSDKERQQQDHGLENTTTGC